MELTPNHSQNQKTLEKPEYSDLDDGFIRVLEDLIDALINNGTLLLTDLPPGAIEKIAKRKAERKKMRDSLNLINYDEELI